MFELFDEFLKKFLDRIPDQKLKNSNYLIISLSKRAMMLGETLAKELKLESDILLQKSIFAPHNKECVIAKISETKDVVIHSNLIEAFDIDENFIFQKAKKIYEKELQPNIENLKKGDSLKSLKNRDVLIVDYGIEDGITALCAIKSLINSGAKSISLAVGVIPDNLYSEFEKIIDNIYFVEKIEDFVDTKHYFKFEM